MFDFDATKLLIVGVIALICIPPKDLPRALRTAGQFVGKMRRMASDFQSQFMDAMHEADMADVRREAKKLAESARVDVGLHDVEHTMTGKRRIADERAPDQTDEKPADAGALEHKPTDGQPADTNPADRMLAEAQPAEANAPSARPTPAAPPQEAKAEPASHSA